MKKSFLKAGVFLLTLCLMPLSAEGQRRKKSSDPDPYPQALYSSMEYRLIGPFRGGRSAAVTGVPAVSPTQGVQTT